MASSDEEEEGEIIATSVTDYYFVGSDQNPIPFSCLPLKWDENETEPHNDHKAFLLGFMEDRGQTFHKGVIAWKFLLSHVLPEIYVLLDSKYGRWIKLQRPSKSYEDTARTALISLHSLHFMKKNPDQGYGEALWKHLTKTFMTTYEVPPSEKDLVDHMHWIKEACMMDKDIAKAKNLSIFLSGMSGKRKAFCEENGTPKRRRFMIFEDKEKTDDLDGSRDAENDEIFDRVCALCDDGGELLCCEGRCIRSFHPTIESGAPSSCESLGYSSEQFHAITTFMCKNCQYQLHQCFICGRMGSSDKSSGAEVFPCVSATCGHFYHPRCVSELVFSGDENRARKFQMQIQAGDSFTCPAHKCYVCKKGEDKNLIEMQFAVCRRCPKAYHRKCLPRNISFQRDDDKNIPQRAWEELLTNRILIYCLDHTIYRKTFTPRRDHLLFPDDEHTDQRPLDKANVMPERRSRFHGILTDEVKVKEASRGITGYFSNKKTNTLAGKITKPNFRSSLMFPQSAFVSERRNPYKPSNAKETKFPLKGSQPMRRNPKEATFECFPSEGARTYKTPEMRKRIQVLMNDSISSFNVEEFLDEQRKCTNNVDKEITTGKVERLVQAIQAALKKLQEGGTIEDAKAVCEPAILSQLIKWKKRLSVYLAPFIHGVRYTSFGRHFTKVEKLKQVVSRLRWYVQDGDTIVDFCCGSNDFSCLMKEELDGMGRKCSFKNYDLMQSKNDFNFEKRDWMSVGVEELPEGSNLIMGLNPPFGVEASRANQFIDKALTFKPKLLILIVPKETERLDRKKTTLYDLIWEDDIIFSGKSFYLPGSLDVHDQEMDQWNMDPPPLYLWSRPDWTIWHKAVAEEHSHLLRDTQQYAGANYLTEENQDCYGDWLHC